MARPQPCMSVGCCGACETEGAGAGRVDGNPVPWVPVTDTHISAARYRGGGRARAGPNGASRGLLVATSTSMQKPDKSGRCPVRRWTAVDCQAAFQAGIQQQPPFTYPP